MKIEVNDYVRTKEGYICKILKLNEPKYDDGYLDFNDICSSRIYKHNVVKSSPNIIDLIDYEDVVKIIYDGKEFICKVVNVLGTKGVQINLNYSISLNATKIKSIVTHEQFEKMMYKIGD